MCLRRIHLRLWHPLLKSQPCLLAPLSKTATSYHRACLTLLKARPVQHRYLASFKGTKTALKDSESQNDSKDSDSHDIKDTPVIHLGDSRRVLDLDRPDDVKRWQVIQDVQDSQLELRKDVSKKSDAAVKKRGPSFDWKPADGVGPKPKELMGLYLQLSKFRLTMLVAATSAGGYGMVNAEVRTT